MFGRRAKAPAARLGEANALLARGHYRRAEPLLRDLAAGGAPHPDVAWALARTLQALDRPREEQDACLAQFLELAAADDARLGAAWMARGDLAAGTTTEAAALACAAAYTQAARLCAQGPYLQAFKAGAWGQIPALRLHADFPFPAVVAVDLEVDPLPGAPPGARAFDVGAVRFKGGTVLAEYQSLIRRDFQPAKLQADEILARAPAQELVVEQLCRFIGDAPVVGHNLVAFDSHHLRGLGLPLDDARLLDSLQLARWLHPDSVHHDLALLCRAYDVVDHEARWHRALPDARACAALWHALGDELVGRGGVLLAGFRALVPPRGTFDRAVLAPRALPAEPRRPWTLDPAPSAPRILARMRGTPPSPALAQALGMVGDVLVELHDPDGAFAGQLPDDERVVLAAASRRRVERLVAHAQRRPGTIFILPDEPTLLCPARMRAAIEASVRPDERLELFCLYQASHNHDAAVLYPFRIPAPPDGTDDSAAAERLGRLRAALRQACCAHDGGEEETGCGGRTVGGADDPDVCESKRAAGRATAEARTLVATHAALLHARDVARGGLLVLDDAADFQLRFAEHLAARVDSDEGAALAPGSAAGAAWATIDACVRDRAGDWLAQPAHHERLHLRLFVPLLSAGGRDGEPSPLAALASCGDDQARSLAARLTALCERATAEPPSPEHVHAYWVDLWFADGAEGGPQVERWAVRGVSERTTTAFDERCWRPYARRIVCGPALTLGARRAEFLERSLGLPANLPVLRDPRPPREVWIPAPGAVAPASRLNRRAWALDVGAFLYRWVHARGRPGGPPPGPVAVTLAQPAIADALARAFLRGGGLQPGVHLLSPRAVAGEGAARWSAAQIAARLAEPRSTDVAFLPPRLRAGSVDVAVSCEASGPLRFLSPRDPLVEAQQRVFANRFPGEGHYAAYALPQALMELTVRLAAPADVHILLDGALLARASRDELLDALGDIGTVRVLDDMPALAPAEEAGLRAFGDALGEDLAAIGLGPGVTVADEDLRLALRALWDADEFRRFEGSGRDGQRGVSQEDVVRAVLERRDQFVAAATGGGKSLCFQLPAVLLAEDQQPKVTLVFSPLIALMRDQVDGLHRRGIYQAVLLNSTLSPAQRQEHLRGLATGDYSIVYLAPEQIYSPGLRRALAGRQIGLIALDEAHCLSQWGHDFRTDYFALKKWIERKLPGPRPREFPIIALTATARRAYVDPRGHAHSDEMSTVDDVIQKLDLQLDARDVVMATTVREELHYEVKQVRPGPVQCAKCHAALMPQVGWTTCPGCHSKQHIRPVQIRRAVEQAKVEELVSLLLAAGPAGLRDHWDRPHGRQQRGLIYCTYRGTTQLVAEQIRMRIPELGDRVRIYHGGLEAHAKDDVLRRFTADDSDGERVDLVVATSAFGMGVDVRRLGYVIHFDTPGSLEAYYQEAGRAGRDAAYRDGRECARCILLYHPSDLDKQRNLQRRNVIHAYQIGEVYDALRTLGAQSGEDAGDARRRVEGGTDAPPGPTGVSATAGTRDVLATVGDIAALAAVGEGSIATILHYLEYHTRTKVGGDEVVERGETANRVWRLKFEQGYQERIAGLPPGPRSRALLDVFLTSQEWGLGEVVYVQVPIPDLADSLGWSIRELESEILGLVSRRIIAYESVGRIRWARGGPQGAEQAFAKGAEQARALLKRVEDDLSTLLKEVHRLHPDGALVNGRVVTVDVAEIVSRMELRATTLPRLTHFLFMLSLPSPEGHRVFDHFARATTYAQPGKYRLRLSQGRVGVAIRDIVHDLFRALREVVARLERCGVGVRWGPFDIMQVERDYARRQMLHRRLLLLEIVGAIEYRGDPAMGMALRVTLLRPEVPADRLAIDLATLRIKEMHDKHKRRLLQRQVGDTPVREWHRHIDEYFRRPPRPIVERVDPNFRSDLLDEQRAIVALDKGYHLVEGGAGCGKTTALIERVKELVYRRHVPLDRIMITTHYNSAVGRIAQELEFMREDGTAALATTINSFGEGIFRKHRMRLVRPDGRPYYPREPGPVVDDPAREALLISKALGLVHTGAWRPDLWPEDLPPPELPSTYEPNAAIEDLCAEAIAVLRQCGVFPSSAVTAGEVRAALAQVSEERYNASALYAVYLTYLRLMGEEGNYYTFDDQVLFALAILRADHGLRREYAVFFEHVIVDEFQDFTRAEALLFLEVCALHENVLAFGDPDQDLRDEAANTGEAFAVLREREQCARIHRLERNFRTTQEILNFAGWVRNVEEDDAYRRDPLVAATDAHGPKPSRVLVPTSTVDRASVGVYLLESALRLYELMPEGDSQSVALVAANKSWLPAMEEVLIDRGLSFSILDGKSLYQLPHVDRVLVYLRLIADPSIDVDVQMWLRRCLSPYFEEHQLAALADMARAEERPLLDLLHRPDVVGSLELSEQQRATLEENLAIVDAFDPSSSVREVIEHLRQLERGPLEILRELPEKRKEVEQMLAHLHRCTVAEALERIDRHQLFLEANRANTKLILTTTTHAKSSEFDSVFLLGADRLPKRRLYVGATRAKRRLFLLCDGSRHRERYGRILTQAPDDLFEPELGGPPDPPGAPPSDRP